VFTWERSTAREADTLGVVDLDLVAKMEVALSLNLSAADVVYATLGRRSREGL
jgi:hypothetical protein